MRDKLHAMLFLLALTSFDSRAESSLPRGRLCSDDPIFSRLESHSKDAPVTVYYPAAQVERARTILRQAQKSYKELRGFFGIAPKTGFSIYLAKNRAHFNLMFKAKTPDWVVGFGLGDSGVAMLDPKDWTEGSKNFVNFDRLVKHEMAHAFTHSLNGKSAPSPCTYADASDKGDIKGVVDGGPVKLDPYWFEEGVATYVSGQLEDWGSSVRYDRSDGKRFTEMMADGYPVLGTVAEFLFEKFGRKKILALIRSFPDNYPKRSLEADKLLFQTLGEEKKLEAAWLKFALKRYPSGARISNPVAPLLRPVSSPPQTE